MIRTDAKSVHGRARSRQGHTIWTPANTVEMPIVAVPNLVPSVPITQVSVPVRVASWGSHWPPVATSCRTSTPAHLGR